MIYTLLNVDLQVGSGKYDSISVICRPLENCPPSGTCVVSTYRLRQHFCLIYIAVYLSCALVIIYNFVWLNIVMCLITTS